MLLKKAKKKLDKKIKDEVPKELPIPKFKKPNPTKSKKKSFFKGKFRSYGGGGFFKKPQKIYFTGR